MLLKAQFSTLVTNGDVVIVVDHDEISQLQVTRKASRFACDTLHGTAISEEGKSVVVDDFEAWLIEFGGCVRLGNGQANGIGKTLA